MDFKRHFPCKVWAPLFLVVHSDSNHGEQDVRQYLAIAQIISNDNGKNAFKQPLHVLQTLKKGSTPLLLLFNFLVGLF